jgi:hypothetical protein
MSEKKMPTQKSSKPAFNKQAFIKAAGEFAKVLEQEKNQKSV